MASIITSSSFLWTNFLLCLFVVFYFPKQGTCTLEGKEAKDTHYLRPRTHIVQMSSLLPSNICNPFTQGSTGNYKRASLEVINKHGPCSDHQLKKHDKAILENSPNYDQFEILEQDQLRVNSIHSKLESELSSSVPAKSGTSMGTGNYIVTVGIGTPKKQVSLIFDTVSSLTWTQCGPCVSYCYKQNEPIFQPLESKSYANVSCASPVCVALESTTGKSPRCLNSTCIYDMQYGESSYSVGYLSKERLSLTSSDAFDNFYFGCGQNNRGPFGAAAGLLGLGRGKLSILQQTINKYGQYFSYCLPSSSSSTGFLSFGNDGRARNDDVEFTPFTDDTKFYGLDMTGISVGGTTLPISQSVFSTAGMIIDTGTVVTRLPPAAYSVMRRAFRRLMSNYPATKGYSILDTCYDLSGYRSVRIPQIRFLFKGGVEVELDVLAIIIVVRVSQVCLAFAGNDDAGDIAIFASLQQRTLEVVYDVGGGRLGVRSSACK